MALASSPQNPTSILWPLHRGASPGWAAQPSRPLPHPPPSPADSRPPISLAAFPLPPLSRSFCLPPSLLSASGWLPGSAPSPQPAARPRQAPSSSPGCLHEGAPSPSSASSRHTPSPFLPLHFSFLPAPPSSTPQPAVPRPAAAPPPRRLPFLLSCLHLGSRPPRGSRPPELSTLRGPRPPPPRPPRQAPAALPSGSPEPRSPPPLAADPACAPPSPPLSPSPPVGGRPPRFCSPRTSPLPSQVCLHTRPLPPPQPPRLDRARVPELTCHRPPPRPPAPPKRPDPRAQPPLPHFPLSGASPRTPAPLSHRTAPTPLRCSGQPRSPAAKPPFPSPRPSRALAFPSAPPHPLLRAPIPGTVTCAERAVTERRCGRGSGQSRRPLGASAAGTWREAGQVSPWLPGPRRPGRLYSQWRPLPAARVQTA